MSRILLTTPTGNTGRHALVSLLRAGKAVRVLVRDARKLAPEDAARVEVVEGDGRDGTALAKALQGVDTAFYCTPQSPNPLDLDSYYRSFVEPFAAAAKVAGLRRVVSISGGDELPEPKGPGGVLRMAEGVLDSVIPDARHIRCGYFMENLLWQAAPLAFQGAFYLPVARDTPLPFVAAADIGDAAGRLLADDGWTGVRAVEAYGPQSLTCDAAAEILTQALAIPVRFERADPTPWMDEMVGHGLSPAMATSLRDMFDAISAGRDMGGAAKQAVECPTHLVDWARITLAPAIMAARLAR